MKTLTFAWHWQRRGKSLESFSQVDQMSLDYQALREYWKSQKTNFINKYQGVAIGCSGGVDSVTLVHLFSRFAKEENIFCKILHVNYGLRKNDSQADQQFVVDLAKNLGLACEVYEVGADERENRQGEGVQEWARRLRRQFFGRIAEDGWLIALGHHLDDRAETSLMRLFRGASSGHLAGMQFFDPPFWRPFLGYSKQAILTHAKEHKIFHREDVTNATIDYTRNRIRLEILPAIERIYKGASQHIAETAEEASELALFCRAQLKKQFGADFQAGLATRDLCALPRGVAVLAISMLIDTNDPTFRQLSRRLLYQVLQRAITAAPGDHWSYEIPKGGRLVFQKRILSYRPKQAAVKATRFQQYQYYLARRDWRCILGSGTTVEIGDCGRKKAKRPYYVWYLQNHKTLCSKALRVYLPSLGQKVYFIASQSRWAVRDLLQHWRVSPDQRPEWFLLEDGGDTVGFLKGEQIILPGPKGEKIIAPITGQNEF